jgi:hypothetical protein
MHRLFGWLHDFDSLRSISERDLAPYEVSGPSTPRGPMLGLATTAIELNSVVHLKDRDEQLVVVHGRDGIAEEFFDRLRHRLDTHLP